MSKELVGIIFTELFGQNLGILGTGGYFKVDKDISLTIRITLFDGGSPVSRLDKEVKIVANHWTRVGGEIELEIKNNTKEYNAVVGFFFNSKIPFELEFYDLYAGAVKYFAEKPECGRSYHEKTDIYRPDIYYLDPVAFGFDNRLVKPLSPGFLVCKSCNRCSRFLPIDITDEINVLGFSNHCKKRAPCTHNAFSRYRVENPENLGLISSNSKEYVVAYEGRPYIHTHYGFQLECRSCKKFVVNAPLNPLRNKAQHHEDGARRRAFERLIIELTGKDVVKNFRLAEGVEFQDYIWNRFSKKCFGHGGKLKKITDMRIDHTLPLAYLWPLDASATALCDTCNSQKHELFPGEFKLYSKKKLIELSRLTGIPFETLNSKKRIVNVAVANLLKQRVEWLFTNFLARKDYQKIKNGKKVADLIYKALNKILTTINIDLVAEYKGKTGKIPTTITLR